MTFKQDWEKTDQQLQLSEKTIKKMAELAYPDKKLISYEVISGGCANLNIKINLENDVTPLILRIYLRDKDAAYREQKLSALIKETIQSPLTYYIGDYEGYRFAITEFMKGRTLRDLSLSDEPHEVSTILYEVGSLLARIAAYQFSIGGFFDQNLNVIKFTPEDNYLKFAIVCLENHCVKQQLSIAHISKIKHCLEKLSHYFPDQNEKSLVHADFDPANILVDNTDGFWKVTGILDWEFSFSGSYLHDVANMLRYAHKMPRDFETSFLKGLTEGGIILPENWRITVLLLNLVALLDCLKRADPKKRPRQSTDICELISYITGQLAKIKVIKQIEVVPYDPNWPIQFDIEAKHIREALGDNFIEIHHIGSTSVPGLAAKPKIDIIAVVRNTKKSISQFESIGYLYKGEFNIPFQFGFSKRTEINVNLHVFPEENPEIELNLLFRDYLCTHPEALSEYANLKKFLLTQKSSFEKNIDSDFSGYNLGKDAFIRKILNKAEFNRIRMMHCTHHAEWDMAKKFRQQYFAEKIHTTKPDSTVNTTDHIHLVLYQGTNIIGYTDLQLLPNAHAAICLLFIDEPYRHQGFETQFQILCESWLTAKEYKNLVALGPL